MRGLELSAISVLNIVATLHLSLELYSKADISGLTSCFQSKTFTKRKKQEVKEIQKRMGKYEIESAPMIALKSTLDRTERRFELYGVSGMLCGADGLPHLVAEPGFALKYGHAGDV
jgi:photosystem I subunit 3